MQKKSNLKICNCTYELCSRKGTCCDCIAYHLPKGQMPACFFKKDAEKTYNRSFEYFAELVAKRRV